MRQAHLVRTVIIGGKTERGGGVVLEGGGREMGRKGEGGEREGRQRQSERETDT